jgi:hypothetical protein
VKLNLVMDLAKRRGLREDGTVTHSTQGRVGRVCSVGSSINGDARLRDKGSSAGRI